MKYCHQCGNEVIKKDKFCPQCGVPLKEKVKNKTIPPKQMRKLNIIEDSDFKFKETARYFEDYQRFFSQRVISHE